MNFDIRNIFRHDKETEERVALTPTQNLGRQVWSAPADFNRETRRRFGLFGRYWRWDLNASEDTRRTYVPRYIRRHYEGANPNGTRRQRRHWARILATSRAKGIV